MTTKFLVRDRATPGFDEATHVAFSDIAGGRLGANTARACRLEPVTGQSRAELDEMVRHLLAGTIPTWLTAVKMQESLRGHIAEGLANTHTATRKSKKATITITNAHVSTGATVQDAFPALPTDGWGYSDKSASPVFLTIDVNDISQGQLADCWFLAALQDLADLDPAGHVYLKYLLQPDVDVSGAVLPGKWVVYFFRGGTITRVHIDCEIDGIEDRSGVDGSDGDYWVDMMEKAYAFFRYGTDHLHDLDYGYELQACSDLGIPAAATQPRTVADMAKALLSGQLGSMSTGNAPRPDMVVNHAYGALAYAHQPNLTAAVPSIRFRNPWGLQGGAQFPEYIDVTDADISQFSLGLQAAAAPVPQQLPSPTDVSANLTANPTSVAAGGAVMLAWSTVNATSVKGSWTSAPLAVSGNAPIYPTVSGTYSITATGANGQSKTASQLVTVTAPPAVHGKKKH